MKSLNDSEKALLLKLLIEDQPFSTIKKELNLNKNYNLKNLCEYLGGKYLKAYNLHINNYKPTNEVASSNSLTKSDFIKGIELIVSQLKKEPQEIETLRIEAQEYINKELENKQKSNDVDIYEIVQLPKILPMRLQGENYVVKQTSVKIVENVWQEFQQFAKANKTYSTIEYLSLAVLEFLEKYRTT